MKWKGTLKEKQQQQTHVFTQVESEKRGWGHIFEHHYLHPGIFVLDLWHRKEDKFPANDKKQRT